MALDWNKEITLSSLLGRGKGSAQPGPGSYPTKTTMNLYQVGSQTTSVRTVALTGVLLAVCIAAFVKFGVLDQLDYLSRKQGELAQQQALVAQMASAAAEYGEVKETFDSYEARYGSDAPDAIAVLDLVEQRVMPRATVTSIVLADDTLTLTLYNVPLDTVGDLAKDLEGQDMVSAVNVTTATTQNAEGQNTVSTLAITLAGTQDEEG